LFLGKKKKFHGRGIVTPVQTEGEGKRKKAEIRTQKGGLGGQTEMKLPGRGAD